MENETEIRLYSDLIKLQIRDLKIYSNIDQVN